MPDSTAGWQAQEQHLTNITQLTFGGENAEAYFDMGVAYGELNEFDSALININKAISLDTGMSRYYYGRAWVYLISGQTDKALTDFNKAAEMGDLDAIIYLEQVNMSR